MVATAAGGSTMPRTTLAGLLTAGLAIGGWMPALAQDTSTDATPALEDIEVPEAGIAMTFPSDWSVVDRMVRDQAELPPGSEAGATTDVYVAIEAAHETGGWCDLAMYPDHPLAFGAHAQWVEERYRQDSEMFSSVESTADELPIGETVRFDLSFVEGPSGAAWLFETDQARYQLRCFAEERPADGWRSIAGSIESVPLVPFQPSEGDTLGMGEDVDVVLDFETTVSVVDPATPDFPLASLMNADCAFALWIEAEDGSATEWLACRLNDSPVQPAEYQGIRPAETVTDSGGECVWRSDYRYQTDRSEVVASAFEITVTPTGQVYGMSTYPAEPLDCPEG